MRRTAAAVVVLAGCVIGFRGEAAFEGSHGLGDVQDVQIDLPSTPLTVSACSRDVPEVCPNRLEYTGAWVSTAGTKSDAREHAETPVLHFDREGEFAALRAEVPLSVFGLVELEMETITIPDDRDLDVRTSVGDLEIVGTEASVSAKNEVGDIIVRGGAGGVGVKTDDGDVLIETSGHAAADAGRGDVEIVQLAGPRDVLVDVGSGDIKVQLADAGNIDLRIDAGGDIRVQTDAINVITSGSFERRTGTGAVLVDLRTGSGQVEVFLAP